jgi:hypothetical protein
MPSAADSSTLTPLAWARIAFAAVVIVRTTPIMRAIDPAIGDAVTPLMGWPHEGAFYAALFGLTLPPAVIELLCVARTIAALLLLVGYRPLLSGLVTGAAGYLVVLQDVFGFTFTQHLLYLGSAVIGLTDCAAVLSVRPEEPVSPRTSLYLLWTFVTSIYFWAAFGKLRRDWFDGRTLGLFYEEGKFHGALARILMTDDARRAWVATLIVSTELALVPLLWVPKTRWVGLGLGLGLHVVLEQVARPDVLGWAMIALLLSFVPMSRRASAPQGVQTA